MGLKSTKKCGSPLVECTHSKRVGCSLHLCATSDERETSEDSLGLSPSVYVTHRLLPFRKATRLSWVQLHPCNRFHPTEASALRWIVASNVSAFRTNLFLKFLLFNFTNRSSPPSLLLPSLSLSTFLHGCTWYFACVKPDLLHFPHSIAWKRLALQKLDVQERGKIYRVP